LRVGLLQSVQERRQIARVRTQKAVVVDLRRPPQRRRGAGVVKMIDSIALQVCSDNLRYLLFTGSQTGFAAGATKLYRARAILGLVVVDVRRFVINGQRILVSRNESKAIAVATAL